MKIKHKVVIFIVITTISCSSYIKEVELINSKANISSELLSNADVYKSSIQQYETYFNDSISNQLLKNKSVIIDYSKKDILENLDFSNKNDTTIIADLNVMSPTGGIPLVYTYDVKKDDVIFFELINYKNSLESFEILEGDYSRFVSQNIQKKDSIKSSFVVSNDNKLNIIISNNSKLKNIGLFQSKINLKLKKLSNISLKYKILNDTIKTTKKIFETQYDTVFKIENSQKVKLGAKRNLTLKNNSRFSINIPIKDSLISWSYWLGLNVKDSISLENNKDNPLYLYSINEINNTIVSKEVYQSLYSNNDDISFEFKNFTIDRRVLNFSSNYSAYLVDNEYSKTINKKAEVLMINNSNINDYEVQFIAASISLKPIKIEIEKDFFEIHKKIKIFID